MGPRRRVVMSGSAARRARRWIVGSTLLFLAAFFLVLQVHFWRGNFLIANDNTWRDFRVYRAISLGLVPLQGPSSSVGGHHGFLAYWIFGLWTMAFHGYHWLQILCLLNFAACVAASWFVAARVASRASAALGMGCYFCTTAVLMMVYPNHIIFMLTAAALAFCGLLRARDGRLWAWLCAAGVTLMLGCHCYGFLFLPVILALDWYLGFPVSSDPWAWSLPAAYLAVAAAVCFLGRWDVAHQSLGIWKAVESMDPALLIRTMPFLHFREEPESVWRFAEALLVAGCWLLAWARFRSRESRAVLMFYAGNFAFFLFYKYDGQYHLPMFAVLPAVLAMGFDAAWEKGAARGLALTLFAAAVFCAAAVQKSEFIRSWERLPGSALRSVSDDLAAVRALDRMRVGEAEFYQGTWFGPLAPYRRLDYLHRLFSRELSAPPEPGRCLRIRRDSEPPQGRILRSLRAGGLAVDEIASRGSACAGNIRPYDGGAIWYLDVGGGKLRFLR